MKVKHPSLLFDNKTSDAMRYCSREAEAMKQLHDLQINTIHQHHWLRMFVPKKFNGLELSLPQVLQTEESLAWVDGSTAWVVTLCAGAAWFIGFFDPQLREKIFSQGNAWLAGSGAATGTAEIIPEGFLINGYWKHASGSLHATVFTVNCVIQKNGKPVRENGKPKIRSFAMMAKDVIIHKTWNSIGMIATGSHSFEVKNLAVPSNRCFQIDPGKVVIESPVYRYPFLQLAETTLAVNLSGMAARFIELGEEIITKRKGSLRSVKSMLQNCREHFYEAVHESWESCIHEKSIPASQLKRVSKTSHQLANRSRELVDQLYSQCGLTAADTREEINRVWRNIHTASQHSLLR